MTFLELSLDNVGAFKGRHTLNLLPVDGKSLILIGALNGSGKTTLLNAFQLALSWQRVPRCSWRSNLSKAPAPAHKQRSRPHRWGILRTDVRPQPRNWQGDQSLYSGDGGVVIATMCESS